MGENKDYISQPQENGSVYISEDVIITVTNVAVKEVEGVCGFAGNFGEGIADKLGRKNAGKGIKVTLKENSVDLDCSIIALYGHPVVEIAKNIQAAVTTAVESMTGLKVDSVNVNVCGISMNK